MQQEKKEIEKWGRLKSGEITIDLISANDPRTAEFEEFCTMLSESSKRIRVLPRNADAGEELPAIILPSGIEYRAVPLGKELGPFLEAMESAVSGNQEIPESLRKTVRRIRIPAVLHLYIARNCPFCPNTVRQLLPLFSGEAPIRLRITDAEMFPEDALAAGVRSVPTLVLDKNFRWTGTVRTEEIAEILADRNPESLSPDSLKQMLEEGRASLISEMMLEKASVFPAFTELLYHEKWPVRLGAMVVAESLAEENRELAGQLTGPLWEKFPTADEGIKGDILYMIGICGSTEDISRLKETEEGAFPEDVREAAGEAIERIQG